MRALDERASTFAPLPSLSAAPETRDEAYDYSTRHDGRPYGEKSRYKVRMTSAYMHIGDLEATTTDRSHLSEHAARKVQQLTRNGVAVFGLKKCVCSHTGI